ncbi:MAG: phosphomannomutase/phosphoglucomutase [Candidatus Sedimenticola sp. (ex Thyasira tokunagai)]
MAIKRIKETNSGAAGREWGAAGLFSYFLLSIVAVVVILALSAGVIFHTQGQAQKEVEGAQLPVVAALVGARISGVVNFHVRLLEGFIADKRVDQLFLSEDRQGLHDLEKSLRGLLPNSSRIHLVPFDQDVLESGGSESLSFATLNLIRTVERSGRTAPAEVHQVGSPQRYVALVVPVKSEDGGAVVGTLHVALPFVQVSRAMKETAAVDGWLSLRQVAGDKPVSLGVSGKGVSGGTIDGRSAIAGTIWEVVYRLPEERADMGGRLLSLVAVGGAAVLISLLLLIQSVRLRRVVKSDSAVIVDLAEKLLSGEGVGGEAEMRLSELDHVKELLCRAGRGAARGPGRKAAVGQEKEKGGASAQSVPAEDSQRLPLEGDGASGSPFGVHEISGIVGGNMTEAVAHDLGRAIGSEAYEQGQQTVIVARDGLDSSVGLSEALCKGLEASGRDVVDIGMVPTPVLYFATHFLGSNSGVMVTGGCKPAGYNGMSVIIAGDALSSDSIQKLRRRIEEGDLMEGSGTRQEQSLLPDYIGRVTSDVQLARPMKVVVDCGNGVAALVAPALLRVLDCEVIELYCEVDFSFPNHRPDPGSPVNLAALTRTVKEEKADLGIAFDSDGDRLGVIDSAGNIIWPDRLLMLLARDVLARQPGADVIYDVMSTRHLASEILAYGGRPIMWKSGHAVIKEKMRQTGALLSGNAGGHIFIKERWYGFDDGIYSCARLLEVLSVEAQSTEALFAALPGSIDTPVLTMVCESEKAATDLVDQLLLQGRFDGGKVIDIDGLRVEFEDGWGLVRVSSSTAAVRFRFEAETPQALMRIQEVFRDQLTAVGSALELPF